jgi:hypothetical protein
LLWLLVSLRLRLLGLPGSVAVSLQRLLALTAMMCSMGRRGEMSLRGWVAMIGFRGLVGTM